MMTITIKSNNSEILAYAMGALGDEFWPTMERRGSVRVPLISNVYAPDDELPTVKYSYADIKADYLTNTFTVTRSIK